MFIRLLLALIITSSFQMMGLDVDEKLTLRILNVSSTKKTILINRGVEDGLVVGDHARFFVPEGVIARGVIIKLAPTRSVWSIYRLVNPDYIKEEEVLSLKITQPVKISDDPSRQVWRGEKETKVMGSNQRIPMAPGARDKVSSSSNDSELNELMDSDDPELDELLQDREISSKKRFEIFGGLYLASLGTTTAASDGSTGAISGSQQQIILTIGSEFYFRNSKSFIRDISVAPFFSYDLSQTFSSQGTQVRNSFFDIGVMVNYHPFKAKPWDINKFIPYFNFTLGLLRSASDSFNPGFEVTETNGGPAGQPQSFTGDGTGSYMSIGGGLKSNITDEWGMRVQLSYELAHSIDFTDSQNGQSWSRESSGWKLMSAISYRF